MREGLEPVGTLLDNLARAEALAWVPSMEQRIVGREFRNRLVHEYMDSPEDLLSALQGALKFVPVLLDVCERLVVQAHQWGLPVKQKPRKKIQGGQSIIMRSILP